MEQTDNASKTTDNAAKSNERIRKIQPIEIHIDKNTWHLFKKISDRSGVSMASMASEAVLEWVQKNRDLVRPEEQKSALELRTEKMQMMRNCRKMKQLMAASSPCRWHRTYPGKPWPGYPR